MQGREFQPPTFGDNCSATTLINNFKQRASLTGAVFPKGNTVVVWMVTDGGNNTATCSFGVTVADMQPPSITCPGAVTVSCAGAVPAPNLALVTATDNCGPVTREHQFTTLPYDVTCINRFIRRQYRATDGSGNTATCSQVITVFDNTAPVFTFHAGQHDGAVQQCARSGYAGGIRQLRWHGKYDLQRPNKSERRLHGFLHPYPKVDLATDACGNTRTATQRISVIDTQNLNLSVRPPISRYNAMPFPRRPPRPQQRTIATPTWRCPTLAKPRPTAPARTLHAHPPLDCRRQLQ
ncbi:MAG: HYR domain-containing protein [Lewinellaceae bacterium]|nr:HYR domain-containing protein [Lewinellaceae bacterium]